MNNLWQSRWTVRGSIWLAGAVIFGLVASDVRAQVISTMTLHGFCGTTAATSTCADNGNITPTTQNPISPFGFIRSPNDNTGLTAPLSLELVFLVPNNASVTCGAFIGNNTAVASATPTPLAGGATWTTGDLAAFLNETRTGGPNNPIGAFLPLTQLPTIDPTATGYKVYGANFGDVPLFSTGTGADPFFTDTTTLPAGTVVLALIECSTIVANDKNCPAPTSPNTSVIEDSTANSGALFESVPGTVFPPVPEPASMVVLGSALAMFGLIRRRRKSG